MDVNEEPKGDGNQLISIMKCLRTKLHWSYDLNERLNCSIWSISSLRPYRTILAYLGLTSWSFFSKTTVIYAVYNTVVWYWTRTRNGIINDVTVGCMNDVLLYLKSTVRTITVYTKILLDKSGLIKIRILDHCLKMAQGNWTSIAYQLWLQLVVGNRSVAIDQMGVW